MRKAETFEELFKALQEAKDYFCKSLNRSNLLVQIYTHLDADGLSSGAIIGKALYREKIPFQIRILKQLEKEEISKIREKLDAEENFVILTDFGSGQYLEFKNQKEITEKMHNLLIIDHHLPQNVDNKDDPPILEVKKDSKSWHVNPYFYGINGSNEVSAAGLVYLFSKTLNQNNIDLASIALVGAMGDIQNQAANRAFFGLNTQILEDAVNTNQIEVIDDLIFSPIKPLNEAIAYSKDLNLPGISGNSSKSLLFLKKVGILMEKTNGTIKTLNDLDKNEKRKLSSAIIEYALKYQIDPEEITQNLVIKRYRLKNEMMGSELHEIHEFSNLLNSCGRSENGSLGIAIAMGDRKEAYQKAQNQLQEYRKMIMNFMNWLQEGDKIQELENTQFFFGEGRIPDTMIGTIASMLIFDKGELINKNKPILGCAKREKEGVFKISARADKRIVEKGINLSEAIRKALETSNLDVLGGGHPPAAGTKVPIEKIDLFLKNFDEEIKKQYGNYTI
jgi:single-stranded-DNA-specific exonuclease